MNANAIPSVNPVIGNRSLDIIALFTVKSLTG